jgi:hypothetical protein
MSPTTPRRSASSARTNDALTHRDLDEFVGVVRIGVDAAAADDRAGRRAEPRPVRRRSRRTRASFPTGRRDRPRRAIGRRPRRRARAGAINVPVDGSSFATKAGFVLEPDERIVIHAAIASKRSAPPAALGGRLPRARRLRDRRAAARERTQPVGQLDLASRDDLVAVLRVTRDQVSSPRGGARLDRRRSRVRRDELEQLASSPGRSGRACADEVAARLRQPVPHHRDQQRRVDVPAREDDRDRRPAAADLARRAAPRRRPRPRPRRRASPRSSRSTIASLISSSVDVRRRRRALVEDRHRQLARLLDRDPVGDREAPPAGSCPPGRRRRARPGRSARSASAIPDASRRRRSGRRPSRRRAPARRARARSSPGRRSPSRPRTRARTSRRSLGVRARRASASSNPRADEHDLGAVVARRLDLRHRRVLRHEDRRGMPELARRPRDRLAVVAGARRDDAGRALSSSSSVASLLTAPRILNEPVRWRFSAFSQTSRPSSARASPSRRPA